MSHQNRGFLQLLAAAALFSTGGAAIKATEMGSWPVAGFRSLVAALVIYALLPSSRRRSSWSTRTLWVGLAYAGTVILFVHANKLTTAASAIFLQLTAPFYVSLIGPRLLGERFKLRHALLGGFLLLGLACFFWAAEDPSASAPAPLLGNSIALASGFCYGLTILGLRLLGRSEVPSATPSSQLGEVRGQAAAAVVCGNLLAFVFCLPGIFPLVSVAPGDVAVVLYLGVFQLGLGYVLVTRGIERVPAVEASFLLVLEPVLNPIWAGLLHHEQPGPLSLLGGAMIIAGSLSSAVLETRERRVSSASPN